MSDTTDLVFLCILIVLTIVILIANMFTIFAFWIHRKKLKRTFLLVINLAFADLFVGFTGILTVIASICFSATYCLQQNQLRYFLWYITNTSRHFCMYIRVFSGAHFSRTSLRFDLAASTSSSKHHGLHQQCGYCVVSWDSSRRIDFFSAK